MTGPLVLESGAGEVLEVFGSTLTLKAMSSDTGGAYSLFEGRFEPGGFRPLPHIHPDGDEGFYVLEGLNKASTARRPEPGHEYWPARAVHRGSRGSARC